MFKSLAILTTALALSGSSMAQMPNTCTVGRSYCSFQLLNNGATSATWLSRIDDALTRAGYPINDDTRFNSLFGCETPDRLHSYVLPCSESGTNFACQPADSDHCSRFPGNEPCCGPR